MSVNVANIAWSSNERVSLCQCHALSEEMRKNEFSQHNIEKEVNSDVYATSWI